MNRFAVGSCEAVNPWNRIPYSVSLAQGDVHSFDFWTRSNRLKEIEIELSDGSKHSFTLADAMKAETIKLPAGTKTSSVKIKIKTMWHYFPNLSTFVARPHA